MVAFANSVRPGHVAQPHIGRKDDGSVHGVTNADNIQKKVRDTASQIYPPIICRSKVYYLNERQCVLVEIEFSGETPHFGGKAWVRQNTSSVEATDQIFQQLIEIRTPKNRELKRWVGKMVTVSFDFGAIGRGYTEWSSIPEMYGVRWSRGDDAELRAVNGFWAELYRPKDETTHGEPLDKLLLGFDYEKNRLRLLVKP